MVDYLSRYRLYSLGYTSPTPRAPVTSYRQLYHDANRHLYKSSGDRPFHDCGPECAREMRDPRDWEARLLSRGLRQTYDHVGNLRKKPEEKTQGRRPPDKLLLRTGELGTQSGDFHYPRGLVATDSCDIVVADSHNHRVQILNQMGVYKVKFGVKGSEPGQFNEPVDVCELPNGDLAVADRRNKRVQVFTPEGKFKYLFPTQHEPYSLACDVSFNIIVATTSRTIEVHRRVGKLLHSFKFGGKATSSCPVQICTNKNEEIIVSDPVDAQVKFFTYDGRCLNRFRPSSCGEALTFVPGGICVNVVGEVLVSDTLNHTVNLYTERGVLLQQLLSPVDGAGTVHSISVGREGHLVATEFSVKGEHCVKIFRYLNCDCHQTRPPSSRRRTPIHFMDI
ncbi:tripartite motif-containing protein 3-like isoform X1 [Haliotis rufescens]|uniref:tripartite motif-containing protein 3-like isoform X1 n=2 Tax=Haliotis rufescens TaxID=6454 RepID=UPI00201EFE50|nr:tripartite motif-containing protein 3-like isoform X1 [Haliotis rufescens]XP_046374307.2 tripartite motif-containing protein 3-like isoform X1 [Haliotis rufescens]